ncbi:hypothetical protein BGW36DRAFT_426464 [Talaromyces proteolyticus]|uniref:Uncharacterized protein n=1 Tax=Talaromyces proteolyticus TaxID=1131652 RepID=A0AAD4Q1P9_9EURO|nr:uncharacterized protein BGW36DRAFT_426464 [Talaromyces proteolyticus]KAH8698773.1 hypothetical protein BGW36DRAFT_426464 [Talaromyces proteolyticus]
MSQARNNLQIRCAENIALALILHTVPSPPTDNKWPNNVSHNLQKKYSLPFDKERSLTGIIAFLSSLRDDPDHIPAVCVREDPDGGGLNVIVAVNKRRESDGNSLLQDLKGGFEQIFQTLAGAFILSQDNEHQHDHSNIKSDPFTEIVSMCSARILNRLHLRNSSKKNIKQVLVEIINFEARLGKNNRKIKITTKVRTSFVTAAKRVVKLVDLWLKHQTTSRLEDLVEGVYALYKTHATRSMLNAMTHKDMDPSLKASLINMIDKVARYRQASKSLYRMAKEYPIVRRMKFVPVNLPQEAFESPPIDQYQPNLASTISRIDPKYSKKENIDQLRRLLNTKETNVKETNVDDEFSKKTLKILEYAKVHAEIQLIAYCELLIPNFPPRVICSSKDACYLCNICIAVYQKNMHIPRCHGRLWPNWRIPPLPQLVTTQQNFTTTFERNIKESLGALQLRQKRTNYPQPNESTLLTLSSVRTSRSMNCPGEKQTGSQLGIHHTIPALDNSLLVDGNDRSSPARRRPDTAVGGSLVQIDSTFESNSSTLTSQSVTSYYYLSQGEILKKSTMLRKTSQLYTAGQLEVQIEIEAPKSLVEKAKKNASLYSYNIEWLMAESPEKRLDRCHSTCVVDVESLRGEISHELCSQKSLDILTNDAVLRLSFYPGLQ